MGGLTQFFAWAGHKGADFVGKNVGRFREAVAEFVAGVTTDPIGMAGDLKADTVLTDSLVNDIMNTVKDYRAVSLGWPSTLDVIKKAIGDYSKHLDKAGERYRNSIMKCVKSSDLKFKSCKDDVLKSLEGIIKVCSDSRILRYNTAALKELIDNSKQKTIKVEGESIGDFSEKVANCAKHMKGLVEHSYDLVALRALLVGGEIISEKQLKKKREAELKKGSPSMSQKAMGAAFKSLADARRAAGNSVGGVFTVAPIPLVVLGTRLGRSTAHSCELSLTKYLSILKSYNPGLNAYISVCLEFIPKIVGVLKEYYSALAVFSKSRIPYKDKLKAKQFVLDLLKKLNRELEFKGKITRDDVAIIQAVKGGEVLSSIVPADGAGDVEEAIKYKVDGWALIDFIGALNECVKTTIDDLNTLINLEDDVIDYEALEIKAPAKPASDKKKAAAEPQAVPAGGVVKESSKITNQRKVLVNVLEKAIKVFKGGTDLEHKVKETLNPLNFVNEKGYTSLAKQFSKEYEALSAAYDKVRVVDLEYEYTLGDGRQAVHKNKAILITSDLKVNSKFLTEALTVSRTIDESTVSKLYTHLTSQCMDNLSDMEGFKSKMEKTSANMIATYGGTSKAYDKACEGLTEILNEARRVGASAFERQDSIREFAVAIRTSSDDATVQRFNNDNTVLQQKIGELNATYDSMRAYLYHGAKFNLVDSNGRVTQEMRRLTLSQLTEVKKGCSDKLKDMKKKAKEIETLAQKLLKDFGGEKTKIDKARTKALKNLEEINNILDKEVALAGDRRLNEDEYEHRYGEGFDELYGAFDANYDMLEQAITILKREHDSINAEDLDRLKLADVSSFNGHCERVLPDAKKYLKAMNSDLSKIKKEIASREKSYNKVKSQLTKNLEKAVKVYNDANDSKNDVDVRTNRTSPPYKGSLPQLLSYINMTYYLGSLKQQVDLFDPYIRTARNADALKNDIYVATLDQSALNSNSFSILEDDLGESKTVLTEMNASKKEFDKHLKAYTKKLEEVESPVSRQKRGFLGRLFKRNGGAAAPRTRGGR